MKKTVFLTGATGNMGAAGLAELLKKKLEEDEKRRIAAEKRAAARAKKKAERAKKADRKENSL